MCAAIENEKELQLHISSENNIDKGNNGSPKCAICANKTSGSHKLTACDEYVHVICGESYEMMRKRVWDLLEYEQY